MRLIKILLPILLVCLLTGTLIYEAIFDTPTYDEPANMAAVYAYVYKNDYRLYPDNPPLVKLLAGLFLYPIKNQINFPENNPSYKDSREFNLYTFGTEFLYQSGNDARKIIFLTRLPNILFTVGIGILLYFFAKKLFGKIAGLLALFFFCFDPNIRGHGHILAFDIPLAFWILLSLYLIYLFYRNQEKRVTYGLLLSLIFALGFLTKFTFVFFVIPLFLGMYLVSAKNKSFPSKTVLLLQASIIAVSFSLLWVFGLSTGYNSRNFDYDEVPIIASANQELSNNFLWNLFKNLPVPYYYKTGMQVMYTHNIVSQPAYLLGEVRARNDWFFYFPVSFLLKTPIPTLIFILLTLIIIIKKLTTSCYHVSKHGNMSLKTYAPFVLGAFYFLCLMFFSHINNVYRYLFPSLILFILGASQLVNSVPLCHPKRSRGISRSGSSRMRELRQAERFLVSPITSGGLGMTMLILSLFLYLLLTSCFSFPHDLSYTNELTGIPTAGYKYLSDSEVDWGQDLARLAKWLKNNKLDKKAITLSYLGTADPAYYGIKYKPLRFDELDNLKGVVAISVGNLTLGDWMVRSNEDYKLGFIKNAPLDILRNTQPIAVVGKSIFVYIIDGR